MKGQSRTDRIVIGIALVILLMASGFFYFDSWMWGRRTERGEKIGYITGRVGDVRQKLEGDLKWSKANTGSDLVYNDAVYAGAGSQADLKVGDSKMTVTENTLVILRREKQVSFLNLNYGTMMGKLASNDKVVIDTGDGKTIELTSKGKSEIVLRKVNGKTQLDVTAGETSVKVGGTQKSLKAQDRLTMAEVPEVTKFEDLRLLKPLSDQPIYASKSTELEFAWSHGGSAQAKPEDRFTVEFATSPDFKKLHASKVVQGKMTTSMRASQSLSLFVRVRGSKNEVSQTEKLNFIRLGDANIIKPIAGFRYKNSADVPSEVDFEIQKDAKASVWYQVASDSEFQDVIVNQNTRDVKSVVDLPAGEYFVRARADYQNGKLSDWTPARPFGVDVNLRLSGQEPPEKVLIPNRTYPPDIYRAKAEKVRSYLSRRGVLGDYFPFSRESFEEIKVQFEGDKPEEFVQKTNAWPEQKLSPGRYLYRYQLVKKGVSSPWSSRKLEIEMEPVRPLGEVQYGELTSMGDRTARWQFTPLLFASSYDVEIARDLSFRSPVEIKTSSAIVQTTLVSQGEYYWRARARDKQGRIISAFSKPYRLKDIPQVPQYLAKNEPVRRPASTEDQGKSRSRVERLKEEPWEASGWWAWFGTGSNFVDYRQSIDRSTLYSRNIRTTPSQYFEGGFTGARGWGGVVSYKNTPGEMIFDNGVTITPSTYTWTTLGLEGIMRRTAPFSVLGKPVYYGLRMGIQQHKLPFIFVDAGTELSLRQTEMTNASIGVLAEQIRKRWTYYWLMRYQMPITSKADGARAFSITPTFAFDGSVGTSYNITQQLKLGLFWYGQWHQFNFVYADSEISNPGFQSLFYSNVDFRLGFDF